MNQDTFKKAKDLERRIAVIKGVLKTLDPETKSDSYKISFGISNHTDIPHYYSMKFEEELNERIAELTKRYCEKTLPLLEEEFNNL